MHSFSGPVEHALAHLEEHAVSNIPEEQQRWYAIKLFERDSKVLEQLELSESVRKDIEQHIAEVETEMDDDAEVLARLAIKKADRGEIVVAALVRIGDEA